jgi:hypothetical protein
MAAVDVLVGTYRHTRAVASRLPTAQLVRQERHARRTAEAAAPDWRGVAQLVALRDELEVRGDPPPPVLRTVS